MSKITLNSIASLDTITAANTINTNMTTIQTAFDNTLSRDGTPPNTLSSSLDMNSNRIINLPAPASSTDPLRVQDLTSYAVPAGTLVTPTSTTVGRAVLWNSTNGTTVSQSSAAPIITVKKQFFSSSGTYTPSTGMLFCIVEAIGSGGGAGGVTGGATGWFVSGGGGAGSFSRAVLTAAQIGASQTVTVNTAGTGGNGNNNGTSGGTVSLGSLVVANGGGGGTKVNAGATIPFGGTGGTAGTGDLTGTGGTGQGGCTLSSGSLFVACGAGGNSLWGAGGPAPSTGGGGTTSAGANGTGFGSGGGGGSAQSTTNTTTGGNGTTGAIWITEFCSQ